VSGPLSANLSSAANGLAAQSPQAAVATEAAALALAAGVEANSVTLAASLLAAMPDRAALTSGSAQAYGFQIQVLHLNGSSTPQTFSGVLVFEGAADWVLVAGPSPGAPFPPAQGVLASGAQIWMATAGQESAQLLTEGNACSPPVPLPPDVTSCKLATFTQAGFSITSSAPRSGEATGSRSASLATQELGGGVSLIIDCSKGTLCPGSGGVGVRVSVSPVSVSLAEGGTQNFSATVTGSSDTAVIWSVDEAGGGTIDAATGHYLAPLGAGTFHVRATSHADTTKYGEATVVVTAGGSGVTVTVTPNPASVATGGTQHFSAQVTGTSNTAVTWTVEESGGGSVDSGGNYTAPASSGTFHVRATSVASSTAFGRAQIFVSPTPPIIVTVIPGSVSVQGGKTQSFEAGVTGTSNVAVTWSVEESGGGTIDASGLYTAPMVSAAQTFHVRATSQADATKFGEATVTVTPAPSITIGPKNPQTTTLAKIAFTVTVAGLSSGAVTWSIVENTGVGYPGGTIDSGGNYTAPATPGTFHVKAVSQADGITSDVSTVTVTAGCMVALPPIMTVGSQSSIFMVGRVPVRVDSQGRPVVAWLESAPYITRVARYENGAWSLLGAAGLPSGGAFGGIFRVDLAIDSHDHPVVAYETYSGPGNQPEIHVATWNDSTGWNVLPAAVPQGSQNNGFALALGAGDVPLVAVSRSLVGNPGFDIALASWNGTSWSVAGGIYGTAGHQVFNPDILVDAAGDVTVAWDEQLPPVGCCATFKPFAKKLSGPGAGLFSSPQTADVYAGAGPSLAFDGNGALAMAWGNYKAGAPGDPSVGVEVSVNGAAGWSQLGSSLPGLSNVVIPENGGAPYNPRLMIRNPDTGMLAVTTHETSNDLAAVYEYVNTGTLAQTWPMVCAPMPDFRQLDDLATGNIVAGLAYDKVNHGFVFASTPEISDRVFVARVTH
jgi:hypothetical protein